MKLVKQHQPITGDQLSEMMGIARPTLRSDLSLLVMLDFLDAKPKVGYFIGLAENNDGRLARSLQQLCVKEVMSMPVIVRDTTTVHDAVVTLFLEDVGSLIVTNNENQLVGVISRKDLLKVAIGSSNAPSMPVSMVMTRQPKIITVTPEETVLEAARKLIRHQVDSMPVVNADEVLGRISKSIIIRSFLDAADHLD
jgi:CBS domain-containing protein